MISAYIIRLWSKARGWALLAGTVLAGLFAVHQSGRSAGKRQAEITRIKETEKAKGKAREIDQKIDSLDSDDLDRRGKRWVRHNRKR